MARSRYRSRQPTIGQGRMRPVTFVEYGDYECPHCGHAYPIVKRVQKHFGDGCVSSSATSR